MDAETMLRATLLELAQKHHLAVYLFHRHIVVRNPPEILLHLVQFVIMSGEECLGVEAPVLMNVLHNRPGYGDAVVGGCAAPEVRRKV